jgi:hypothetical protein
LNRILQPFGRLAGDCASAELAASMFPSR